MKQAELDKILESHRIWLESGEKRGERAYLKDANLTDANLRYVNLTGAYLKGANLIDADLRYANLASVNLMNANLGRANLRYVNLTGAYLIGANLRYVNLTGASLRGANLECADLEGMRGKLIFSFQIGKHFGYHADGYVKIGCECHRLEHWVGNVEQIGQANSYSEADIGRYRRMLTHIQDEVNR